jgi:hypothetical protein
MSDLVTVAVISGCFMLVNGSLTIWLTSRIGRLDGKVREVKTEVVHVKHAINSILDQRVEAAKSEGNLEGRIQQTQERSAAKGEPL